MLSLCCGRRRRSGNQSLSSNEKNWHPVTTTPYRDNDKTWRPESPTPICCCHEDIVRPVIPPGARPPVVNDILALLLAPSDTTESKDLACAELAHASGWSFQSIAEASYEALQKLLANEKIERWGSAIADAYKISVKEAAKIVELADKFANEHPILTGVVLAVIALGILYLTAPILLDWLGFTSVGPRAGNSPYTHATSPRLISPHVNFTLREGSCKLPSYSNHHYKIYHKHWQSLY